jgi:hypothetical protein
MAFVHDKNHNAIYTFPIIPLRLPHTTVSASTKINIIVKINTHQKGVLGNLTLPHLISSNQNITFSRAALFSTH